MVHYKSMEPQFEARLASLEKKIDAIYISTEKTRKYFLGTMIVTAVAFVLPLIGLLFAIPTFLSSFNGMMNLQ